jgi:dihydrofolate reductase
MGKVRTGLAVSLDGFISGPNDGPEAPMGVGGERLLAWYAGGDTEYRLPGTDMVFMVSAQTAEFLRETRETTGALVFGRRTFDLTHGWGGKHPLDVPVFVVSSSVPQAWVYEGSPFRFVTDGLESALEQAQAVAGDKDVGVGAASIVQQSGTPGRDPHRSGARPARGRRRIVRPPGHRADRPGAHEGDRGRWGHPSHLPRPEVNSAAPIRSSACASSSACRLRAAGSTLS